MIMTYEEAILKYKNRYLLSKALRDKQLVKIEKGYYSTTEYYNEIDLITKKYPSAILTYQSAYFYHGLTDYIPNQYFLATSRTKWKINDSNVKQIREIEQVYGMGLTLLNVNGVQVQIYDRERMLIELIRNQSYFSFDYYKELISEYRKIVDELDMDKLIKYLNVFKRGDSILEKLNREVF